MRRYCSSMRAGPWWVHQGTYLFFVTSFSGHCRALKHKETIKTCMWEALDFMFKICERSRADTAINEHRLCFGASSWVSSVSSVFTTLCLVCCSFCRYSFTPSLSRHLCYLFSGSCPPAGNQKIWWSPQQYLAKHWIKTILFLLHHLPEMVGLMIFKGEVGHQLSTVTTGALDASRPTLFFQM